MATETFFKLDKVKGESRKPRHIGEIEIIGFSFNPQHNGKLNAAGIEQNGGRVKASEDFSISKKIDSISQVLMRLLLADTKFDNGVLTAELISAGGNKSIILSFKNLYISSISASGSDLGIPVETVGFTFEEVKIRYIYK